MSTTLCAIMKNEEPYIVEWVAYHRLLGFDRIVIYENDSSDGTPQLLEALAREKVIDEFVAWPSTNSSPQLTAYADGAAKCKSDWIMFLDADEFLNIHSHPGVSEYIADFPQDAVAVGVNWRVFGSSGQTTFKEGLVVERFQQASLASDKANYHIKSLVRPGNIVSMHIHEPEMKDGTFYTGSGNRYVAARQGISKIVDWSHAQVNHYFTKSRQEYDVKKSRGNANRRPDAKDKYTRHTAELFNSHDLNDELDITILRNSLRLHSEYSRISNAVRSQTSVRGAEG